MRLSVRGGRIEGSTADINAGTIKLADGQAENVRLAGPVFVVEPSGRYRASADLSIGGGVLGRMELGQVQAKLVATSSEIQLNDFKADIFKGQAAGSARIAIGRGGTSRIAAAFTGVDIAGPLTAFAGGAVPLAGIASGKVDLAFPGTDFKQASGTLNTQLTAAAGDNESELIPINGELAVRADRGLFQIQRVDLQTAATKLKLRVSSHSKAIPTSRLISIPPMRRTKAVLISSGLLPDVEEQMRSLVSSLRASCHSTAL